MQFFRSIIYALGSYIALIVIVSIGMFMFFLPLKYRYGWLSKWTLFSIWWLKVSTGLKFKVIGSENIPKKPCVIASNHQSTWETIAFLQIFPYQVWVLKKELLFIPFFGWGLALMAPIVINRGEKMKALKKIIKQGTQRLKQGLFVVVFPEGTRKPHKQLGEYKVGVISMAKKSVVDILPVYHNAGKFWPKGSFNKNKGCITVTIGKCISTNDKKNSEVVKELENWTLQQQKLDTL